MLVKIVKFKINAVVLLLPLIITACGGGGGGSSTSSTPGTLSMATDIAADSDVVLGGSHKYELYLSVPEGDLNPKSITLNVTSSNNQVATIEDSTCSTGEWYVENFHTQSCSFYVKGISTGSATISVTSNDYESITYQINVSQKWGTFSSGVPRSVYQMSFGSDSTYAFSGRTVHKSAGASWQLVGGGDVITDTADSSAIVSDDTHVCVGAGYFDSYGVWTNIKCSTNDSTWQELPRLNGGEMYDASLSGGNIYLLVTDGHDNFMVMSCPVDNCISWQQQSQSFHLGVGELSGHTIFESIGFIQNNVGTYYTAPDGSWQLYGSYVPPTGGMMMAASDMGVTLIPSRHNVFEVYNNTSNNIGGEFTLVGGDALVDSNMSYNGLAMEGNNIFVIPGDGNVYVSANTNESWSSWGRVGNNNPALEGIYINNNKVYSVKYNTTQVYVYTLD